MCPRPSRAMLCDRWLACRGRGGDCPASAGRRSSARTARRGPTPRSRGRRGPLPLCCCRRPVWSSWAVAASWWLCGPRVVGGLWWPAPPLACGGLAGLWFSLAGQWLPALQAACGGLACPGPCWPAWLVVANCRACGCPHCRRPVVASSAPAYGGQHGLESPAEGLEVAREAGGLEWPVLPGPTLASLACSHRLKGSKLPALQAA